jgi:hypothetical protein
LTGTGLELFLWSGLYALLTSRTLEKTCAILAILIGVHLLPSDLATNVAEGGANAKENLSETGNFPPARNPLAFQRLCFALTDYAR